MNRYYKANEEITLRFYQMPKVLFSNPRYKGLGLGAKAMYSILRDRQDLSIKNNWFDEENNIFLVFSIETLAELLDIDRKTVMKYKRELVKYELIIDKRLGQGKSNRIYVLKPEIHTNVEIYERSKKGTSESPKNGPQQVQKRDTSDTDFKDTDFIETVGQSKEENKEQFDGQTDIDINTNDEKLFKEIVGQADINSYFKEQDRNLLKDTIRRLLDLKELKANDKTYSKDSIRYYLKKLVQEDCDSVLRKYAQSMREIYIKNKPHYLNVLLFNCVLEKSAIAYIPY